MATLDNLKHIAKLLSNVDSELRGIFEDRFKKIMEVVLRKEKKNDATIAGLERAFQAFMRRVETEQNRLFGELKQSATQITDDSIKRQSITIGKELNKLTKESKDNLSQAISEMKKIVSDIKIIKGEKGDKGEVTKVTEEDIRIAIEGSDVIKNNLKKWDEQINESLRLRRGRTGFGGASVIVHNLKSITHSSNPPLVGTRNGVNKVFTLPKAPKKNGLSFFLDGARLTEGATCDYTLSGKTVTLINIAPPADSNLVADIDY